jgi:hypothetical protein
MADMDDFIMSLQLVEEKEESIEDFLMTLQYETTDQWILPNQSAIPGTPDYLEKKYVLAANTDIIEFNEPKHEYTVNGTKYRTSVTAIIHNCFEPFDAVKTCSSMISRKDFKTSKKYQKYRDMRYSKGKILSNKDLMHKIIQSWDVISTQSRDLGTKLHNDIELFYNGLIIENDTKEYQHFLKYHKVQMDKGFVPFRTEIKVCSTENLIVGCVDMLYCCPKTKTYHLRDWKRSKKIMKYGFGKRGKGVLNHLNDCNFVHYSLQLNMYKFLLENSYGIKIEDMAIAIFHPSNPSFLEFSIRHMPNETKAMLLMHQYSRDLLNK